MSRIHVYLVLTLFVAGCNQDAIDDSNLPDDLKQKYREDAARLTFVEESDKDGTRSVELPQKTIDAYYEALVAVFNSEGPQRDQVVDAYEIHAFISIHIHSVIVHVNPSAGWTESWRNGQTATGNSAVDDLTSRYGLSVTNYIEALDVAVLESDLFLNTYELASLFEALDGVVYAEPDGYAGDGNRIDGLREDGQVELTYSHGWGDCPSGCINRHFWLFRVRNGDLVDFLNEFGDPLP